ncbi:unnamed protein product [Vicia faba]|uniref:Uncharacterized protein n=1 Tax=Vicia faba TaxID=3906 RepID=A0AAV1AVG4_VICFA|nr:unnamed protein product [Vicia faba]
MLHSTSSASVLISLRLGSHGGTRFFEFKKMMQNEGIGVILTKFEGARVMIMMVQDYREDPQDYNHGIPPLKRSEPNIPVDVLLEATKPIQPFPWDSETDLKADG